MRGAVTAVLVLGAFACGQDAPGGSPDPEVDARTLLTAPAGVRCIRIVAAGVIRTETKLFGIGEGEQPKELVLQGLPTGDVLFAGDAFDVPCASIASARPTWIAEPVTQRLEPGVPATVMLRFHPAGGIAGSGAASAHDLAFPGCEERGKEAPVD